MHQADFFFCLQVMVSLVKIVLISMRPGTELVGKLPGTEIFCDISQFPVATKIHGTLIIRVNSSLFCFANANFIREKYDTLSLFVRL